MCHRLTKRFQDPFTCLSAAPRGQYSTSRGRFYLMWTKPLLLLAIVVAGATASGSSALAQGWILDRSARPNELQLENHQVSALINHQVATVTVSAAIRNPSRLRLEGTFLFPLPAGAAVSAFTLKIDGEVVGGELLPAKEARRTYEEIVRNVLDPALLEWADGNLFRARVFPIDPGASREITLTYDLVLDRTAETVRFVHPLTGALSAGHAGPHRDGQTLGAAPRVTVEITSDADVRNLYSPTNKLTVKRSGASTLVEAGGKLDERARSFVLYYSLSRDHLAATLLTHRPYKRRSGYFMLMLDPPVVRDSRRVAPRDIVFVLDTSGSMAGEKIAQAREAVSYALDRLGEDDRFGLVAFSSDANAFTDELVSTAEVDDAHFFVDQLEARGGTNINEALAKALAMLDDERPGTIVFLTDGLPSTGVVMPKEILQNARANNTTDSRIFAFGVGYDVNTDLLDGLATDSRAFAEYIGPDENIEERVSSFYDRVRYPVMTDITIASTGVRLSELAPRRPSDLFLGDALTLTGRYARAGKTVITVKGTLNGVETTQQVSLDLPDVMRDDAFVARVWATRRIGVLLESIRLEGENEALIDEIVALAKEFGIVTPYTSYLVTEDEARFAAVRELDALTPVGAVVRRSERFAPEAMSESSGKDAVEMSKAIWDLKQARVIRQDDETPLINILGQNLVQTGSGNWLTQSNTENAPEWNLKFGSQAYFAFFQMYPDARAFLKLGNEVAFLFRDQLVVVDATGTASATPTDLRSRFGS